MEEEGCGADGLRTRHIHWHVLATLLVVLAARAATICINTIITLTNLASSRE